MTSRLMAFGLVGSAGICVFLSTQVSATPPPGEEVTSSPEPAPCTKYLVEISQHTLAFHARTQAMAGVRSRDDFVSAMHWIYTHDDEPDRVFDARSTLARCGASTNVDRCVGYVPDTAEWLERNAWESEVEWEQRVARAQTEAKVCGATLPEAKDPGPDCSPSGVEELRVMSARAQRSMLVDRVDNVRSANRYRSHLARCGHTESVDPCYGTSHKELAGQIDFIRDIMRDAKDPLVVERWRGMLAIAEREVALCANTP